MKIYPFLVVISLFFLNTVLAEPQEKIVPTVINMSLDFSNNESCAFTLSNRHNSYTQNITLGSTYLSEYSFLEVYPLECSVDEVGRFMIHLENITTEMSEQCKHEREQYERDCEDSDHMKFRDKFSLLNAKYVDLESNYANLTEYQAKYESCNSELILKSNRLQTCNDDLESERSNKYVLPIIAFAVGAIACYFFTKKDFRKPGQGPDKSRLRPPSQLPPGSSEKPTN